MAVFSQVGLPANAQKIFEPTKALNVKNPIDAYPNRGWEEIYRNIYRSDREFKFNCVPNDTHNCKLVASVRNGIVTRIEQSYDTHKYSDLYGNKATANWNPRGCLKGFTLARRVYGPYRIKYPMVRSGWMEWVKAGFPDPSTPENQEKYFKRGQDSWVKLSWDESTELTALALKHIAQKYSGDSGAQLLKSQGYNHEMIEAMDGAGTQTMKLRPGMPACAIMRLEALARFGNMFALLDSHVRGVGPDKAKGGRFWSSYTWHGDLDPGTPMVTGIQTFDPEFADHRNAKLYVLVGKNFVENKMPEAHWFTELIERGGKIVVVSPDYNATSSKADYWLTVRPGSDTALFLGVCNIMIQEKLYDEDFIKRFTDLPLLVREDTLKILRASDVIEDYKNKKLENLGPQIIDEEMRQEWGDYVVWDKKTNSPSVVTRDDVGEWFDKLGIDPEILGTFTAKLKDGTEVKVKTVLQLQKEVCSEYDLDKVHDMTGSPKDLIVQMARDFGTIKPVQIHNGEGVNHYFHSDIKDRVLWIILAMTGNVGKPGANFGHWAGNYRTAGFGVGLLPYVAEDPFNITLNTTTNGKDIKVKKYYKGEEPCYWLYNERPLVVDTPKYGPKNFTGKTHMPTPTKVEWYVNVNHLNNCKGAYNIIKNVHPKVEMIVYHDWEWNGSCEYADVVFPVHSWLEMTQPEMTMSPSNPFLMVWEGGIKPIFDTKQDSEVLAVIAGKLSDLTGDGRYRDYFKYITEVNTEVYMQRILDASNNTEGYQIRDILKDGIGGRLMMSRTTPRIPGWEQINESQPFYNKTGRLEFYREEDEFIEYGENTIVHREPVEATPYLPNAIVNTHSWIRPDDYGISVSSTNLDEIQVRNVKKTWDEVKNSPSPLQDQGFNLYCMTNKSRHTVHSSWANTDWNLIWSSSFGDPLRMDKRQPAAGEHQIIMNPETAKERGINDGDYVWVDGNPADRPYIGWKETDEFYKIARLKLRVKLNHAFPKNVTMMKHASAMATHKSVMAHEIRADGLAKSGDTGYQATIRYGSQQSITRGHLQPTMMTDSLVRKDIWGNKIGKGYMIDVHAPNTCPKETMVKVTKAEDGGIDGVGLWDPAKDGLTPGNQSEAMKRFIKGDYISVQGEST